MMTQSDLSTKHVMGGSRKSVNTFGCSSSMSFDDIPYEAAYNEKMHIWETKQWVLSRPFQGHLGNKVGLMTVVGESEIGEIDPDDR